MDSIQNLLSGKRSQFSGFQTQITVALVLEKFNAFIYQEFGDIAKSRVQAVYLKNDILCLAVLSGPLTQEIKFREADLLQRFNQQFPKQVVRGIRYLI